MISTQPTATIAGDKAMNTKGLREIKLYKFSQILGYTRQNSSRLFSRGP